MRVRVAHGDYTLTESRSEEWLLIVWPKGEAEPTKYWLSTLPEDISFHRLVDYAKLRWRIEGIIWSSNRRWGSVTSKARMAWVPSPRDDVHLGIWILDLRERAFPPQLLPKLSSRNLPYPKVTDPEAPPLRPGRHVPNSIATLRRRLIIELVAKLSLPMLRRENKRAFTE